MRSDSRHMYPGRKGRARRSDEAITRAEMIKWKRKSVDAGQITAVIGHVLRR